MFLKKGCEFFDGAAMVKEAGERTLGNSSVAEAPIKIRPLKLNFVLGNIRTTLNFLLPLVTFPYLSRVLGPESLGRVEFANSIVSYFVLFAALGIPMYGVREIARVRGGAEARSCTVLELGAALFVAIAISYTVYFPIVAFVPQLKVELTLFLIVAPTIFLSDFSFEWFYVGIEDQLYITVRYLITKVLQLAALFLLVHDTDDVYIYAAINVGLSSISTVFNITRLRKYQVKVPFAALRFGRHLKPALYIFAAQVATSVYIHLDVTMLGLVRTKEDVGVYTAANRIVRIVISVVTSLSAVIVPRIENALNNGDFAGYRESLEKSLRFTLLFALPCIVGLEVVADDAISVFAGNKYEGAVLAVRMLSPIILIVGLANFVGLQVLFANRRESMYTVAVSIAAVCNFIANLILIPKFGLYGAIFGTVVAECVGLLIETVAARVFLRAAALRVQLWKYVLATTAMGASVFGLKWLCVDMERVVRLVLCVTLGAVVYAGVLALVGEKMLRRSVLQLRKYFKKGKDL